jgi:hypothetical protein
MRFRSRQRSGPAFELGRSVGDDTVGVEARLQALLDALLQAQFTTVEVVQATRVELERRHSDLVNSLALVAQACDSIAERIQTEHDERTVLVESLARFVAPGIESRPMTGTAADMHYGARVLGGSVSPASVDIDLGDTDNPGRDDAALDTVPSRGTVVEVRFGGRWFAGFEVCEVVARSGEARCRVRRIADGLPRPEWFYATEIRQIDRPVAGLA